MMMVDNDIQAAVNDYPHESDVVRHRNDEHLRLLGRYHLIIGTLYGIGVAYSTTVIAQTVLPALSQDPQLLSDGARIEQSSVLILMLLRTVSVLLICLNGWFINRRRFWLTCVILSVLECAMPVVMNDPMSIILGLSATLVLRRPAVRELFLQAKA